MDEYLDIVGRAIRVGDDVAYTARNGERLLRLGVVVELLPVGRKGVAYVSVVQEDGDQTPMAREAAQCVVVL